MEEELAALSAMLRVWCVRGPVQLVRCARGATTWWGPLARPAPAIVWSVRLQLACNVLKVSSSQELPAYNAMLPAQHAQLTRQIAFPAL